jgi:hypothetical protein
MALVAGSLTSSPSMTWPERIAIVRSLLERTLLDWIGANASSRRTLRR